MERLIPVMVRTFGRTGSTLLMQILGTHQNVCFERQYPFETRYLTYVYNMSRMMGLKAKVDEPWDNDVLFRGKQRMMGCLPYGNLKSLDRERLSQRALMSLWQDFSAEMRETAGLGSDEQAFYAEKVPPYVAETVNDAMPAKNLFLLRDPRDEMVSIMSFNHKRGFKSFGWLETDTDVSYAQKICRNRQKFMQLMIDFEANKRRLFVRYEDLIRNGDEEVERLSEWLGLPLSLKKLEKEKKIREVHMTSTDPSASVERWRRELSDEVLDIFKNNLGDELTGLGYAV